MTAEIIKEISWVSAHTTPRPYDIAQHFTASALVLLNDHVLLVHHKRIGAWLPPGGHIDEKEMPHQAAVREVLEETGIEVEVLSEPLPVSSDAVAFLLPSPLCLQAVHAVEKGVELYHVDINYLCRAKQPPAHGLPPIREVAEVKEARWVNLADIGNYQLARNVPEVLARGLAKLGRPSPQI